METTKKNKVIVFGLDCAPPQLVFQEWRAQLPCLSGLMEKGFWGPLRSSDPPITVPAWSSMLSGKSPAELGFYGFKTRKPGAYFEHELVTSQAVRQKRVWDYLAEYNKKSVLVGIPQTFPAPPVLGHLVSCFLTPSLESACTFPPELKQELLSVCPEFTFDVPHFRSDRKQEIFDNLLVSMKSHFKFFDHLLSTKDWDFAMLVEIGTDRLQHCFWNDWDPQHPLHDPQSSFKNAMFDYYCQLDSQMQQVIDRYGKEATLMVVSDHGAKSMLGAIAINEWLIEKGYLRLKEYPKSVTPISKCQVDWGKSLAWAEGGYYGRLYFNVKGREAEGSLDPQQYETFRQKIRLEIKEIRGVNQSKLLTKTHTAEELYGIRTPGAPDLFVYFDDLNYRCLGSVGSKKIAQIENDMGPDGANHDYEGILIMSGAGIKASSNPLKAMHLTDVARTILGCYGIHPGASVLGGRNLCQ